MILIDGYNVLHAEGAGTLLPLDAAIEDLAELIALSRYRRRRPTIVCDGAPPAARPGSAWDRLAPDRLRIGPTAVVYAGPGADADSLIEAMIDRCHAKKRLTVVSSDRRLIAAVRRVGGRSLSSAGFLRQLGSDADASKRVWRPPSFASQVPLARDQTRMWMRLFGFEPGDLPRPTERSNHTTPPIAEQHASPIPEPAVPAQAPEPDELPEAPVQIDPLLVEALEEWRGRLSLDDLSMEPWIDRYPPPDPDQARDADLDADAEATGEAERGG
ncbi:MAG: NYN domain-containing protein [Planctomycetota bacterium]